ncbi:MAG: fibronectin type III domain-containing protein [Sulfuricellaceae bacterium]
MGISRNIGLAGGLLWAHLRRAMRLETTQAGDKSARTVSLSASLLSVLAGFMLLSATSATMAVTPKIVGGGQHAVAMNSLGDLWVWGANGDKRLGDCTTQNRYSPTPLQSSVDCFYSFPPSGFISIAAAADHTLGVASDGLLWGWGHNGSGQLGTGNTTFQTLPRPITSGFGSVATSWYHSMAIKTDGSLWGWGDNFHGELGDGSMTASLAPKEIGTGFSAVALGPYFTIALKPDGTLWAWGQNYFGQLGDGTTVDSHSPKEIGSGYSAIAAGNGFTLALKSDGSLWTWGRNEYGQLGDGTTASSRSSPLQIGAGFSAIAAGSYSGFALKTDGRLFSWGRNEYGEIGDGSTTQRNSPVEVGAGFISIAAGNFTSFAVKSDGSVWTWGRNSDGERGDGTTDEKHSPTLINFSLPAVTPIPATPTGFTATADGASKVNLAWNPPSSNAAANIRYYVRIVNDNGFGLVFNITNWSAVGLTPATNYSFTIKACDTANNCSAESAAVTATTAALADTVAPSVPTNLNASAIGSSQISLNWSASNDNNAVAAYKIYRNGNLLSTLSNITSYNDTGLPAKTTYSYAVAACDTAGNCSAQSSAASATTASIVDTTPPSAPSSLSASATGSSQISLNWSASSDNVAVTAYKVYRNGSLLSTLGNVTSYNDTNLTPKTSYSYAVAACDTAGNCSAQSSSVSATTAAAAAILSALSVACPVNTANGPAICTANASYNDGSSKNVVAAWTSSNTAVATIGANGQITVIDVDAATSVTFSASYTENGATQTASATVIVTPNNNSNACNRTGISIAGGASKKVGESLSVNYCMKNFSKLNRFDVYVAVRVPDNNLIFMKAGGFFDAPVFTSDVTPYLANTQIPDLSGAVLSMAELPQNLPLGRYTFYAVPVLTGMSVENTANWIGGLAESAVTLGR